ncbi:MAG: hypothetical protein ACYCYP_06200 [Leptospirales bacterium]
MFGYSGLLWSAPSPQGVWRAENAPGVYCGTWCIWVTWLGIDLVAVYYFQKSSRLKHWNEKLKHWNEKMKSQYWVKLVLFFFILFWPNDQSMAITGDSVIFSNLHLSFSEPTRTYDAKKANGIVNNFLSKSRVLTSYRCTMRNFYHQKAMLPDEWFILSVRYPIAVRVDLIYPRKGAQLVYLKSTGMVSVRPFGFLGFLLTLSRTNRLLVSRFGHTINHADFRSFATRILEPACMARACLYLGKGLWRKKSVYILNIAPDVLEAHRIFGRMLLLVDVKTGFPVMIETISPTGKFMERVEYRNCQLNVHYPKGFF